jgi:hypothetical protein
MTGLNRPLGLTMYSADGAPRPPQQKKATTIRGAPKAPEYRCGKILNSQRAASYDVERRPDENLSEIKIHFSDARN